MSPKSYVSLVCVTEKFLSVKHWKYHLLLSVGPYGHTALYSYTFPTRHLEKHVCYRSLQHVVHFMDCKFALHSLLLWSVRHVPWEVQGVFCVNRQKVRLHNSHNIARHYIFRRHHTYDLRGFCLTDRTNRLYTSWTANSHCIACWCGLWDMWVTHYALVFRRCVSLKTAVSKVCITEKFCFEGV